MDLEKPVKHADFALRLRQVMKEQKLTQVGLAALTGVTQPTVSFWLNEGLPKIVMCQWIAECLNVSRQWLIYGVGKKEVEEIPSEMTRGIFKVEEPGAIYLPSRTQEHATELGKLCFEFVAAKVDQRAELFIKMRVRFSQLEKAHDGEQTRLKQQREENL